MRSKEQKQRKKGQETTIGKIIYSFLLFMPLFAILTGCLISTFNIQTKEESEIHYKYETNEVNSINDLVVGNIYHFKRDISTLDTYHYFLFSYDMFNIDGTVFTSNSSNIVGVLKSSSDTLRFNNRSLNTNLGDIKFNNSVIFECDFVYAPFDSGSFIDLDVSYFSSTDFNVIQSVETHNVKAEEVFYRSVNKVIESPLFNWAEYSIIYTTTASTCNALSITTPFVPLLLSYWLIISVIYFLYDIALMLVWILHRKIHELQESI